MASRMPVGEKLRARRRSETTTIDLLGDEGERRRERVLRDGATYPTHRRLLTAQEEARLATRARAGDPEARQAMMEANIRLVMSIARRYTCKSLTFEDL